MKTRVLVVIYTEKQIRTFLETGAFSKLGDCAGLTFLLVNLSSSSVNRLELNGDVLHVEINPRLLSRMGTFFSSSRLWRFRNRSQAHYYRAIASFGPKKLRDMNSTMILYNMDGWNDVKRLFVRLMAKSPSIFIDIFEKIRQVLLNYYIYFKVRNLNINSQNFLYAVLPFSGLLSSEFDDFTKFFQKRNIPVVAIQENWDNLSSKTFISSAPNYFLVWGEQSRAHVKVIHNLKKTTTYVVGSPRFLPYQNSSVLKASRKGQEEVRSKINGRDYVLITGTGDGIDDYFIITQTYAAISTLTSMNSMVLFYRPHPFTRNRIEPDNLKSLESLGIVLDNSPRFRDVFYHTSFVSDAKLVINQFSTILLETLHCNNKVLLPSFVDRPVIYDYSKAVDEWFHFIGLKAIPNVYLSTEPQNYQLDLINALEAPARESAESSYWMVSHETTEEKMVHFHRKYFSL